MIFAPLYFFTIIYSHIFSKSTNLIFSFTLAYSITSSENPDLEKMIETFQNCAKAEGFELYIIKRESKTKPGKESCIDASFDFPPFNMSKKMDSWRNHLGESICRRIFHITKFNRIFSYPAYVKEMMQIPLNGEDKIYPTILPSFDNSCRRINQPYMLLKNSSPELFGKWAAYVLSNFEPYSRDENLVFVNAWNEWAEGNHLEPDQKWGTQYLEKLHNAILLYNS